MYKDVSLAYNFLKHLEKIYSGIYIYDKLFNELFFMNFININSLNICMSTSNFINYF